MKKTEQTTRCVKRKYAQGLPVCNHNAAGIDVGDTKHDVAIDDGHGRFTTREYLTFTQDIHELVDWLVSEGITTVAMESTGIYWLCLYALLEEAGIEPYLVNAKHVKNVTGRKKDDTDAIWIQKLHSCGLLQKSYQPDIDMRVLRTYVRHRKKLVTMGSDCARRMQKSLEQMNIKLHVVISDILGKTGLAMVEAIVNGQRDPDKLLILKNKGIKANDEEIKKSLTGMWREEYLFTLQQAFTEYNFYQSQIQECDTKIEEALLATAAKFKEGDITGIQGKKKVQKPRKNQFHFNARPILQSIVGVDLCDVDGISEISAVELISEIGNDMNRWKNEKHFSAWLNVVPNTKITGGRIISSKMQKKKNHAGQTLRMACCSMTQNKGPMGDYAKKMRSRLGKKGGVVATAHKLSRIIYTMIKEQKPYDIKLTIAENDKWKQKKIAYLEKQLARLKKAS